MALPTVHASASAEFKQAWYRKQVGATLHPTRAVSFTGRLPPGAEDDMGTYARYATSIPLDTQPEACWTWAIPPWMRIPNDTTDAIALRAQLGATTAGAPSLLAIDYPGPELGCDAVFSAPWRQPPLIPHPADALDLLYWYRRST
ncbi:hypothetical protein AB0K15_47245 [Amycolatopsis sp. NPDC049253]|uniref:hypothetical protein n=1 Tax=Amycolatopsis sp. NPDC049253 TaxID=3155274 RepID=UPI0034210A3E